MSLSVATLLAYKGNSLITIPPGASVSEAVSRMVEADVGSVLVVADDRLQGVFTEREYLRRVVLEGRTPRETRVEAVMTTGATTVGLETSLEACLALLTEPAIRYLPVLDADRLVGVVSIGDCVRAMANARDESTA
ncbi:MAG: CBS domain-containing protein [Bacteroidota bacterium]